MQVSVQVALGNMNELLDADYRANELPPGKMSTKGIGKTAPDPAQDIMLPNGVKVPLGTPKDVVGRVSLPAPLLWFLVNTVILVFFVIPVSVVVLVTFVIPVSVVVLVTSVVPASTVVPVSFVLLVTR